MLVRDLIDGQELDQVLLVRERDLRVGRDGREELKLVLGDRTGTVLAWLDGGLADLSALCATGRPVRVRGQVQVHPRFGPKLALAALQGVDEEEVDWSVLLDGPPTPVAELERQLAELLET